MIQKQKMLHAIANTKLQMSTWKRKTTNFVSVKIYFFINFVKF